MSKASTRCGSASAQTCWPPAGRTGSSSCGTSGQVRWRRLGQLTDPGRFPVSCGYDLADDVTRLADPQSHTGRQHGGDHLRGVRPHGERTPQPELTWRHRNAADACLCPQGRRILAASHNKSALLWRLDDSVPKVTYQNETHLSGLVMVEIQTCVCGSGDSDGSHQEGDGGQVHLRPPPGGDRKHRPERPALGPEQSRL